MSRNGQQLKAFTSRTVILASTFKHGDSEIAEALVRIPVSGTSVVSCDHKTFLLYAAFSASKVGKLLYVAAKQVGPLPLAGHYTNPTCRCVFQPRLKSSQSRHHETLTVAIDREKASDNFSNLVLLKLLLSKPRIRILHSVWIEW